MRKKTYKGNATIRFSILRYKNPLTLELVSYGNTPFNCDWEEIEIPLIIKGFHYYDPGVYSGPYENSYPMESDTEILEIYDKDLFIRDESQLTNNEVELIKTEIAEYVEDDSNYSCED